jgi:hypothetical protein
MPRVPVRDRGFRNVIDVTDRLSRFRRPLTRAEPSVGFARVAMSRIHACVFVLGAMYQSAFDAPPSRLIVFLDEERLTGSARVSTAKWTATYQVCRSPGSFTPTSRVSARR